jgi:cytochrome c553
MKFTHLCAALALLASPALAWCQAAPSADPVAGQKKTAMCGGCHGIPGWRTAYPEVYGVPKIGGQHPTYIVKALQAYKSGERSHPSMRAVAASLSDQDMADLAAYYGGPEPNTASK